MYENYTDERGVMHPRDKMGPGNADDLLWVFSEDIQNFKLNFTWGFWTAAGKWHRPGEGHLHPEEEALIFVGLDPERPDYLGAEIEIALGKEFERHFFNTPTCVVCPKGFVHLPVITRWCDSPYSFIVACLGDVHEAAKVPHLRGGARRQEGERGKRIRLRMRASSRPFLLDTLAGAFNPPRSFLRKA
jgi:hypothetical protein